MNYCETCVFWDGPVELHVQAECTHELIDMNGSPNALWADAYEKNGIFTGPNFGCVHHSPKNAT